MSGTQLPNRSPWPHRAPPRTMLFAVALGCAGCATQCTPREELPFPPSRPKIGFFHDDSGLTVSWQDNSDNERGFKVYRKIRDAWRLQEVLPENITRFVENERIRVGATYEYQVCSYNGAGESERVPISITRKEICDSELPTCEGLLEALRAEALRIRSCSADTQCGQVMSGTSCGCTRNLVARLDADTTCYYDIRKAARKLHCDIGDTTCDCPQTDGFICSEHGLCEWNYLGPPAKP